MFKQLKIKAMKRNLFNKDEESQMATMLLKDQQRLIELTNYLRTECVNIKKSVFNIGKYLSEVKQILPHGKFQPWIEEHFNKELPYSTAALYMKIYEKFERKPKAVLFLPVYFLLKMSQNDFPEEVFLMICENANSDKLDVKTITEAYESFKHGEIELGQFESIAEKQIKLAVDMEWGRTQRIMGEELAYSIKIGFKPLFNGIKRFRKQTLRLLSFVDLNKKASVLNDIDCLINELNEFKTSIKNIDGFLIQKENKQTGKREWVSNDKFINSNN